MLSQAFDQSLIEEELKEPGFGDVGRQFDVIETSFAKFVDDIGFVVFKDDEIHDSPPCRAGRSGTTFFQVAFTLSNPHCLHLIDDVEQLSLASDQLRAGLADASIFVSHFLEAFDLLPGWRDGLFLLLSAVGEDGGLMELPFGATAIGLAAFPLELIERRGQERRSSLKILQQCLNLLLGLVEFTSELAEFFVHVWPLSAF
jgi:hypothetical protein